MSGAESSTEGRSSESAGGDGEACGREGEVTEGLAAETGGGLSREGCAGRCDWRMRFIPMVVSGGGGGGLGEGRKDSVRDEARR